MKHLVPLMLFTLLFTVGCDLFNEAFLVSVNMDPVTQTYNLSPGSSYTLTRTPFNLSQYVDAEYQDDLEGGGLYDIGVMLSPSHTGRTISGTVVIYYGGDSARVSYTGAWNDFTTERTVLRDPTMISIDDPVAFNNIVNAVYSTKPLPVIELGGGGNSTPAVVAGDQVTISLYGQIATMITLE